MQNIKNMHHPALVRFLLCGLLLLAVLSCTDHETAIFYFIANESELAGTNQTENFSVQAMTVTANHTFYYLAAGPSIWVRAVTGNTWRRVKRPAGADVSTEAISFRPANSPERLYAGFESGLYFTEDVNGQANPVWQKVRELGDRQVTQLKILANNLVVALFDSGSGTNALFYRTEADDTFHAVNGLQGTAEIINDFIFDGTQYWVTSGSTLFNGQLTGTMTAAASQPPSSGTLMGLIFTVENNYYVATDSGQVFLSGDGMSWVSCGLSGREPGVVEITDDEVPFLFFGQAPSRFGTPDLPGQVLAGSFGFGFFTIPDGSTVLTRFSEFTITPLFSGAVNGFFIDGAQVFVLTGGGGLWVNTYTPGVGFDSNWIQE